MSHELTGKEFKLGRFRNSPSPYSSLLFRLLPAISDHLQVLCHETFFRRLCKLLRSLCIFLQIFSTFFFKTS